MTTKLAKVKILPYRRQGEINYSALKSDADEKELPPDHMEQNREIVEVLSLLSVHLADFDRRPDIFLDRETNICYNPRDLNVRIAPDVYIAFGVDAEAIRTRKLYLPWEAGKVPDWVLEVASESTSRQDLNRKPAIYAQIGIPEFWRFDPTGGRYYGQPLYGGKLQGDMYHPIDLTTEPDGILKGYSDVLGLSLSWDEGWPLFHVPSTGTYLENWRQVWFGREAERAARAEAEARSAELAARAIEAEGRADAEAAARARAEAELRRLRELLGEQ
jgi:Uma2 family endonuclease